MSFFGSLLGTDASAASNAAAADTYGKQKKATDAYSAYGNTLPGLYNQISQGYDPYVNAGSGALNQLQNGLGLNGQGGNDSYTSAFHNQPGYQSGLNTGLTGAQRGLQAGGIGQSGAALKGLYRYGSDYENQRSGDYMSRLMALQGQGLQATGARAGMQAQGVGANTGVQGQAYGGDMQSAGTIGQGMVAGAQAEQTALGNLMNVGGFLGGSFLGGNKTLPKFSFGTGPGSYGS
jgi:hypothetical protein